MSAPAAGRSQDGRRAAGSGSRARLRHAIGLAGLFTFASLTPVPGYAADAERTIQIDGLERTYVLHVPSSAKSRSSIPLVVVLHGGGGNAAAAAKQTRFNQEASKQGFAVAYPNGTDRARPVMNLPGKKGRLTWNAGGCCGYAMENGVDDVAFIRAMVEAIAREYPIDRRQIHAVGMSNGAMMAYRLACEASDVFAAIGAVSGPMVAQRCVPKNPVSIIHIHGTDDGYVPDKGGVGPKYRATNYPSVQDSISFWTGIDGCKQEPTRSEPAPGVRLLEYAGCRGAADVSYYSIEGGGHSWPGGDRMAFFLDAPSKAIAATPLIWQFFAQHPRK